MSESSAFTFTAFFLYGVGSIRHTLSGFRYVAGVILKRLSGLMSVDEVGRIPGSPGCQRKEAGSEEKWSLWPELIPEYLNLKSTTTPTMSHLLALPLSQ